MNNCITPNWFDSGAIPMSTFPIFVNPLRSHFGSTFFSVFLRVGICCILFSDIFHLHKNGSIIYLWLCIKVINHCIFRNLKDFLYGEEHRMYFCNIPVFMTREKKNWKNIINKLENDLFYQNFEAIEHYAFTWTVFHPGHKNQIYSKAVGD